MESQKIAGNVYFLSSSSSLSSPIACEYLHINDNPVAVIEEREFGRRETNEDEVS